MTLPTPIDDADLALLDALAEKATQGPWRNLCAEWNEALDCYYRRTKKHWHGTLPGTRGKSSTKHCASLIVRDVLRGKPIDLRDWFGCPDYYDLKKIIAEPLDLLFPSRGRKCVTREGAIWDDTPDGRANADFIAAANPSAVRALIAALRAERAKNADSGS